MRFHCRILYLGFALLAACGARADNNFSRLLLKTEEAGKKAEFTLDRTEFVYFKTGGGADSALTVRNAESVRRVGLTGGEGFLELPAGRWTVEGNYGDTLLLRTVPYLVYDRMCGSFDSDEMCTVTTGGWRVGMWLYNWKYLRKHILGAVNCVGWRGVPTPEIAAWREAGRKSYINYGPVHLDPEEDFVKWSKRVAEQTPTDGITLDEFVTPVRGAKKSNGEFGYDRPGHGITPEIMKALKRFQEFCRPRGVKIFAWVGMPWNANAEDNRLLWNAAAANDDLVWWEAYCNSKEEQKGIQLRIADRFTQFRRIHPNAFRNIAICLGTMEFSDNCAEVDFKVFLDKCLHEAATSSVTGPIRGIGMWCSAYTDPEILLWYAALLRHYGIEGRREMLSGSFGYKMNPGILSNPEFDRGSAGWKISGKVEAIPLKEAAKLLKGRLGYYPRSRKNLLKMTKVSGKPNRAEAALRNLKAGSLYQVRLLVTEKEAEKRMAYPLDVTVSNAEIVERGVRQGNDFGSGGGKQLWNYVSVIFRKSGTAPSVLTLSDRGGADDPEVLLVDAPAVTPYYMPEPVHPDR